jgi:di/tricarboxylate transporter
MVLLWLSSAWHDLNPATVVVLSALALITPGLGLLAWKEALGSVSWDLVIFVAAALVLGEALIATGAAAWLLSALSSLFGLGAGRGGLAMLAGIAALSLTAHLYMRRARRRCCRRCWSWPRGRGCRSLRSPS